MFHQMTLLSAG